MNQKTIEREVSVEGPGLFSGRTCHLRFCPAEAGTGVLFVRRLESGETDEIPCSAVNLAQRPRRTALAGEQAAVDTVEHVLSAVAGLGIDNVVIEVDAEEMPAGDASCMPFVEALQKAGAAEQDAPRDTFAIDEPVLVSEGEASVTALPGNDDCLDILYEMDYGQAGRIGKEMFSFSLGRDDYAAEIAPARTFLLKSEADQLQAQGVGAHLTPRDVVVVGDEGVIDNELRFLDELVRHKVADLIGDLMLTGRPLAGRIVACRSGHELNHTLARKLHEAIDAREHGDALIGHEPPMDIRKILRLLPHRYPFLMVDRVIEMDGERRAVGVKNVTINEPFFQGHYPGQPIMPGVLILEAMAQLSGLLLSRRLEATEKVAVLLSIDKVKMRRPVRPGDQLILEAESLRSRGRTGHCSCRARVGNEVAAEANIKFMLVDSDRV